jgi:hypothetical protein
MTTTKWKGKMVHAGDVHVGGPSVAEQGRLIVRDPYLFDHFEKVVTRIGSSTTTDWGYTETGTGTPFAISATGSGEAIGVTGGTTNNGEEIGGNSVIWKPSTMALYQPLVMEVRAKFVGTTTVTDGDFAIGFADAKTFTSSLPFVVGLTSVYTTQAPVEFAGFHYSSIPTSGALYSAVATAVGNYIGIQSIANSVATAATTTAAVSTGVKKDSGYHVYRVEVTSDPYDAVFYIDGVQVGQVGGAVTGTVALTPYICVNAKASHVNTATIDYIFVGGGRV